MKFKPGQIINIDLGSHPNEVKGYEQANTRPCLVIKHFSHLSLLTIVPITSKKQKYDSYSIVEIDKGEGNLVYDSFILCHQIRTVSEDRILAKIGIIGNNSLLKIKSVIVDIFDF